jgi:iron(III) transport system substrate-binding protein
MKATRRVLIGTAAAVGGLLMGSAGYAQEAQVPSYYPDDYSKIIEASKQEDGLLIYSNMAEYNWRPVIEGFNKLYPWIEVSTLDLGSDEVFTRYYAERSSGAETTDLMISATVESWLQFLDGDNAMDYKSPEAEKLPDWSMPRPGFYTVSTDPIIIAYNKLLVPEDQRPKGIENLVELVKQHPETFDNALTTYNSSLTSFGQSINLVFLREHGDQAWQWFDVLGPKSRTEQSSGPMLAKLTSGEYKVGYFISGIVFFPKLEDPATAQILGWNFIEDGTPLFMRMMAIPQKSGSVNSAKLMLDFILSHDGQAAFGRGGLTPYRPGVTQDEVAHYTYDAIKEEVGEDNLLLIDYDPELVKNSEQFIERWKKAYQAQ